MKDLPPWRDLLWLLYPAAVIVLILLTIGTVLGGPDQAWVRLVTNQKKVDQQKTDLASLQTKLKQLQSLDAVTLNNDLAWLDTVIPRAKRVDVLLSQIEFAAQVSGSTLNSYQGNVGQLSQTASAAAQIVQSSAGGLSLKVDYTVPDFNAVVKLLSTLEQSFPLLKIDSVDLGVNALNLNVESSWTAQNLPPPAPETPLPQYSAALASLKSETSNYQQPQVIDFTPVASTASGSPVSIGNPFTVPLK